MEGLTRSKAFSLMVAGVLLSLVVGAIPARADQPGPPPTGPAVAVPANTLPPSANAQPAAAETPPPVGRVSLRDKLFHRPLFSHPKGLYHGCSTDDPDMGCGTCHSEWVFLFGSCCAFYNEPFYYSPWR